MSISQEIASIPVRKEFIGYGDTAIWNTLKKMKKIIRSSVSNYYVRRWAEEITSGAENDLEVVEEIYDFVSSHTRFTKDPLGFEYIVTPPVVLRSIEMGKTPRLDCDDLVVFSLSLIGSLGVPVAMRAASYKPDKKFTHVYGLVKLQGEWIPLELVESPGLGLEHLFKTRTLDMEV